MSAAQLSPWRDFFHHAPDRAGGWINIARSARDVLRGRAAFSDAESRAIFDDILIYRHLTPHWSKLANNAAMYAELEAFMSAQATPVASLSERLDLLGEPLAYWEAQYPKGSVQLATTRYGLYWAINAPQYYFSRNGVYVGPEAGDVIFDCGTFAGESAVKFALDIEEGGKVYSFDPSPLHVKIAKEVARRNNFESRIEIFPCGVAHETRPDITLALKGESAVGEPNRLSPGRRLLLTDATISIDDFCAYKGLEARVDYLKMDIEGSEMSALDGAHRTIMKFKPKLAICLYHHDSDLWTIPAAVKSRYPFYDLYLEHYSLHGEETVMYAVATSG